MESNFIVSLSDCFYKAIITVIQTMCMLMGQAQGTQSRQVIDLKTIFLPLLLIRLRGRIELGSLFAYKLFAVQAAFIDGQGCFVKAFIINLALSKVQIFLTPHGGSHYDIVASIEECFNNYTDATKRNLGFDKYDNISAKDNERMWRASEVVIDYDLSISSHLDRCNYEKQIQ